MYKRTSLNPRLGGLAKSIFTKHAFSLSSITPRLKRDLAVGGLGAGIGGGGVGLGAKAYYDDLLQAAAAKEKSLLGELSGSQSSLFNSKMNADMLKEQLALSKAENSDTLRKLMAQKQLSEKLPSLPTNLPDDVVEQAYRKVYEDAHKLDVPGSTRDMLDILKNQY
jgi:hypothetical protein